MYASRQLPVYLQRALIAVLLCIIPEWGSAETYGGIGPLDQLPDLRARFPGASFELQHPAWAKESDVMYRITGEGMSGTIVVKLTDNRPFWRSQLEIATDSTLVRQLRALTQYGEESIVVDWVRWVPTQPIPLQRFASKYGAGATSGFDDSDMQPYRQWASIGVICYLSDDAKFVVRVDYQFTRAEYRQAYLDKFGYVPDEFKEVTPTRRPTRRK